MQFWKKQARKRDAVIGFDLGSRQWKGVAVQRTDRGLQLCHYVVAACPSGAGKTELLASCAETVQQLFSQLKVSDRQANVAISSPSALVAMIEMPRFAPEELRTTISLNSTRYLRRDLGNYYVDAVELGETTDGKARRSPTMQTLVAGAPKEEVLYFRNMLAAAKIKADTIELGAISVINALQCSHREICEQHLVLLLDIGHQVTSLNFLRLGQPVLTRLMPFGGAQVTEQIARELGVTPADAEQQKHTMSAQMAGTAQDALQTLAREVRSSIDFVERQYDCEIRHAFAGGGTACNPLIVAALSQEVGLPIQRWNPLEGCNVSDVDAAALEAIAPCLGVAVGVAVAKL
jgi:type IV pilus assembly protein PilM